MEVRNVSDSANVFHLFICITERKSIYIFEYIPKAHDIITIDNNNN